MSGNLFGNIFRVMTFGESHGPFIGLVIDGIEPGLNIDIEEIQKELDRRKPGQSRIVTSRKEKDRAQIISGIFEGKTTGTPLCILIQNQDQRSKDYSQIKDILRPGHASFSFLQKYGVFDYRGGGRASGRETATRVAAGAVAKQFLKKRGLEIIGYTRQISDVRIKKIDFHEIEKNPVRAPDPEAAKKMSEAIEKAKEDGDALGGIIEIVVRNVPAGLGEPVFNKLDADIAQALMSIGAVKAFEVGDGFESANMTASEFNDPFYYDQENKKFRTKSNHAGGVLGGITNGENLVFRIAVKPPSSIRKEQETVDLEGNKRTIRIEGRHDPCICPRIVPVAEAMVALVLIDHILMQERLTQNDGIIGHRRHINTIDTQILLLLAQRQNLIHKIGHLKKERHIPFKDDQRESEVMNSWIQLGQELSLPKQFIIEMIEQILKYSIESQKAI